MKYVGLYDNNKDIVTKDKLDAVEAAIPTKTSQLDNDSGFITASQAPVQSVNNKTGPVSLTASDVGALPADTVIPTVNNATLTIKRNSIDVGSFTANAANDVNIDINVPTDKSDIGLGNVDNVKQYSATNPPPYPVTSVNGQTGEVNLVASEVGAVPTSRTVNGKALSANITLTASDVGAATMTQVNSAIQNAIGNAIGGSY